MHEMASSTDAPVATTTMGSGHGNDDSLVFDGDASAQRGQRYCRAQSKARSVFGRELLGLYGRQAADNEAVLFPSGMAAISAAITSLATAPTKPSRGAARSMGKRLIVHGNELYCDVASVHIHMVWLRSPCRTICQDSVLNPAELFFHLPWLCE